MDWFNKHISKGNMIKALCFTQTDSTTDAVVFILPIKSYSQISNS